MLIYKSRHVYTRKPRINSLLLDSALTSGAQSGGHQLPDMTSAADCCLGSPGHEIAAHAFSLSSLGAGSVVGFCDVL